MIKQQIFDIRQKVLKRYIGTFCESSNENDAVKKIRNVIKLDDSWESSYKVEDFSNNITISFTNGKDVIEIKFLSTVGNATNYAITVNDKRVISKTETDDIKNIINFVEKDKLFKDDLNKINDNLSNKEETDKEA
jgi:hypothetical protein